MDKVVLSNLPAPPVATGAGPKAETQRDGKTFGGHLEDAISEINRLQWKADEAIAKVQGEGSGSMHEAMIALERADVSFRTMMQVRNKIIEAYQEIMRMQV